MFIASKFISGDIRKIEGALARLIAYASLKNLPLTIKLAEDVLVPDHYEVDG